MVENTIYLEPFSKSKLKEYVSNYYFYHFVIKY